VVEKFKRDMMRRGVGDAMVVKTLTVLQSVLSYAVASGELDANPVREVRKPSQRPKRVVRPLSPEQVEALRRELDPVSASYAGVLAYAGPRPGEGLRLLWRDVGERTLLFDVTRRSTRT
jgi:integrase